ncbi:hypothetical protein [Sphingomonas changbaiensis]|nr:hypothetical protein [Sphingomonas changbaiensis]
MTTDQKIAVWSKSIDTQMHFNEMATKSRQLGLAFVAAALGVGLVLLGQGEDFSLVVWGGWRLHVTVFIILAGVLALTAVRKLDLGVYHQMLRGAVAFGEDFEETHMKPLLQQEKGLTQAISHFSRNSDASANGAPGSKYGGSNFKTAGDKVGSFYTLASWVLIISALLLFAVTNASNITIEHHGKAASDGGPTEHTERAERSKQAEQDQSSNQVSPAPASAAGEAGVAGKTR